MRRAFKISIRILFVLGFTMASIGLFKIAYIHAKATLAQQLLESAWTESIISNSKLELSIPKNIRPWSWADTWPIYKLSIPSINLTSLVLKDASGESLAFGPGLLTQSIKPGEFGNSFIAAHRDTHFKAIKKLLLGQNIMIQNRLNQTLTFVVDRITVVDSRVERPETNSGDTRITLVTCYPFEAVEQNTPFRYLVSAQLL